MDLPEDLKRDIDKRAKRDKQEAERRRQEVAAEKKELARIEKFRQKNKKKLMALAKFVAQWVDDFFGGRYGKEAIKISYGALSLFCSNEFFHEVRLPKPSYGVHSEIIIYDDGNLTYREGYKFYGSHLVWEFGKVPIKAKGLFKKLHPEYLELFAEHLKSGKVWKDVEA